MIIFSFFFPFTPELIHYCLKCMGGKGKRWCTSYMLLNSLFFGFAFLNRLASWTSSRAGFEEIFHRKTLAENHLVQDIHGMKSLCIRTGYFQQILSNSLGWWRKANIISLMQVLWWRKMPPTSQLFLWAGYPNSITFPSYHILLVVC